MKKTIFYALPLFLLILSSNLSWSQTSSQNGIYLPVKKQVRALLVFLQIDYVDNPQLDVSFSDPNKTSWLPDSLPAWKDDFVDYTASSTPNGTMTKYYYEASFGNYYFLGDYIDTLFTIADSSLSSFDYSVICQAIFPQLNAYGLHTSQGAPIDSFDLWQNNETQGALKTNSPDNPHSIDHVMFLIRNRHLNNNGTAGSSAPWSLGNLWGYAMDSHSKFNAGLWDPVGITYHEFGHLLYGGNNFHTVGNGAGDWTFMFRTGGYSGMSSSGKMSHTSNAWDRRRLGWKHASNTYNISARAANGTTEVNGDLVSADDLPQSPLGELVLRDCWKYGDAVRIKLPYLNDGPDSLVRDQWLWLENRQGALGSDFDLSSNAPKGIYAYVQVGKEDTGSFGGIANYLHFLPALGSYDLTFSAVDTLYDTIRVATANANPFTGYHHLMQPALDMNDDDKIKRIDNEFIWPKRMVLNGQALPIYHYTDTNNVTYGTVYDAFTPAVGSDKIGLGTNPAAVPVLSYETRNQTNPLSTPRDEDNRSIHLNGISVEVLEQDTTNGNIRIKVRFDDYEVTGANRWCGNIVLHDKVELQPYGVITLDQGYTPQKPISPQTIDGEKVFADATVFTMKPLSVFKLEANSTLRLKGNSTLLMEGGVLEIKDSAKVIVEDGARLIVEDTSQLQVKPGGLLQIDSDGELIIRNDPGTTRSINVGEYRPQASPPSSDNPAAVAVYGELTFDSVNWVQTGQDGLFKFYSGHQLNLDPGYEIILQGIGDTTDILELYTPLKIEGHDVTIDDAAIYVSSNAYYLQLRKAAVNFTDVTIDGGALKVDSVTEFDALRVDVKNADTAFVLRNIAPTTVPNYVRYCDITSTTVGVAAYDVDYLIVENTDIVASGIGIYGKDSRYMVYKGELEGSIGVKLDEVQGFYATANGTSITGNTGIEADHSLVFLRNGAVVEDCNRGFDITGSYDETAEAYTAMLSLGDEGCGSIVHNNVSGGTGAKAIYSKDCILNLDATLHAVVGGNDEYINPNNIYDNGSIDGCYEDPLVSPDTVFARGNFWDPTNYTLYENLRARSNCQSGGSGFYDIALDTSSQSSCDPEGYTCSTCGTRDMTGLLYADELVFTWFGDAYDDFVLSDDYTTRSGFSSLAAIELLKDTTEHIWRANSIEEDTTIISHESAHLIQVAKAIYLARTSPSESRIRPEQPVDIFADYFRKQPLEITLFPNPARHQLLVDLRGTAGKKHHLKVFNSSGQLVYAQELMFDRFRLDVKDIGPRGMYFVAVYSTDGEKRAVEKLVIR